VIWVPVALAEPVLLRQPATTVAASIGPGDIAVGGWYGPIGATLDLHNGVTLGLAVGTSRELSRAESGFGARVALAAGLALPTLDPGLVVEITPALLGGWQRERGHFEVGLVAPAAIRVAPRPDGRLPLLAEMQGSHWFGPVRVGAHAGAGSAYSYISPTEITYTLGLDVGMKLDVP
jgi:hypothetical protein